MLESLLAAVDEAGLETEMVGVAGQLAAAGQRRLGKRIAAAAPADLLAALTAAAKEADLEALAEALKARPKKTNAA